jgi:SAM-dependent methyltransferase
VTVISDFDAIAAALAAAAPRDDLTLAECALVRHIPPHAKRALDVGCGDGVVSRAVARRGIAVLAIDVSPRMVALARARTAPGAPVEYRVADITTDPFPRQAFDVVLTINMVHHVPLAAVVPRLVDAVAPGGVLLIQDVVTRRGLRYLPLNAVAAVWLRLRRLAVRGGSGPAVAALYKAHGESEVYLEPGQVARAYRALLPGARVLRHLDWRYSVIWHRAPAP